VCCDENFIGSSPLDLSSAVAAVGDQAADSRQQMMLSGPIPGTLLRFAASAIVTARAHDA